MLWATTLAAHACDSDFDCSGGLGVCNAVDGTCSCKAGWTGSSCNEMKFVPNSARRAYPSTLWTWGGSPIVDDTGVFHLFSSEMSNQCGILHYCVSSRVIHLTSPSATGPYTRREIALSPRADAWDNGAIHGISVHRLPNKTYVLFYMGSMQPGLKKQPNCSAGSGEKSANSTFGSHAGRRIGIATAQSLEGPWRRLSAPIFGPDAHAWDNIDVSNPSPIIQKNGSVILLYKGRGSRQQHMGLAFASSINGPYVRNSSGATAPNLPGEDPWGWVDDETGIFHAVFHTGNGRTSAGSHRWSADGIHWYGDGSTAAYTGLMNWANDADPAHARKVTVLARRERPQILLQGEAGSSYGRPRYLFTSAEDCMPQNGQADAGVGRPCVDGALTDLSYTALVEIDLQPTESVVV